VTELDAPKPSLIWSFVWGMIAGIVLSVCAFVAWRRLSGDYRYHYVVARDMSLVTAPSRTVGTVPRGSDVFTLFPLDYNGDDYGSDAWIRVGIHITDAEEQGLSTFQAAGLKEDEAPNLWLTGAKAK